MNNEQNKQYNYNYRETEEVSIDERMQDTPMPKVIHSKTMDKNTIGLGSK